MDVVAASDSDVRVALIRVRWCGCGSSELLSRTRKKTCGIHQNRSG